MPAGRPAGSWSWRRITVTTFSEPNGVRPHTQLVDDDADGVQIRGRARDTAFEQLGRDVLRRADDLTTLVGRLTVGELGDAEVDDASPRVSRPGLGDEHVLRLEVAVHQALCVHRLEAEQDLAAELDGVARAHGAVLVEQDTQARAVDQVGDDRQRVALHHEVAHGDDVGVVDVGQQRPFPDEPRDDLRLARASAASSTLAAIGSPDSRTRPRQTSPVEPRPMTVSST